jgi:predicted nucleic acid-binding protein
MAWLLDTNIISETRRLKPEPKVLAFIADHPLESVGRGLIPGTALFRDS